MRHSDENPEMKTNAYKLQRYKSVCQAWGRAWMGVEWETRNAEESASFIFNKYKINLHSPPP